MATFHDKRDWLWTREERENRKSQVRRAQTFVERMAEQVRRINDLLPQFAEAAGQAFRLVAGDLKPLTRLDLRNRGRKYQPVSPEETDRVLQKLSDSIKPWHDFANLPEYQAALRSHNARVREHNKVVAAANKANWEQVRDVMELADRGDVVGVLRLAAERGLL